MKIVEPGQKVVDIAQVERMVELTSHRPVKPEGWEPTLAKPFPDPIPTIIPFGSVTVFAGAAGVGKTAMLAEWFVRIRDGRKIWGHDTNVPTEILYVAADRQWASHQQWFDTAGFKEFRHYSVADDKSINAEWLRQPQNALKLFDKIMLELNPRPGALITLDPVAPLFILGDQNRPRDVAATLLHFSRFTSKYRVTLICTAHFSKQKSDVMSQYRRPQDRISGSGAFAGFSDTQMYLVDPEPPDQPYHVFGWVPRHCKPETVRCVRDDHGLFVPCTDTGGEIDELLKLMPEGRSISIGDLEELAFETLGMSRRTLYRRLEDLETAGQVERERGRIVKRWQPWKAV